MEPKELIQDNKHTRILKLISAFRDSHPDMVLLFTEGQCYNFFLILRAAFPEAEAWYDGGHVYTKIDDKFYDITGSCRRKVSWEKLDHKLGDKPHRWGLRDTRRFIENE